MRSNAIKEDKSKLKITSNKVVDFVWASIVVVDLGPKLFILNFGKLIKGIVDGEMEPTTFTLSALSDSWLLAS